MKLQDSQGFEKDKWRRKPQKIIKLSIHNLIYLDKSKLNKTSELLDVYA